MRKTLVAGIVNRLRKATAHGVDFKGGGVLADDTSHRILASIPLEIEWDEESQLVSTAVINLNGALILSRLNWPPSCELRIKNPNTGLQTLGRVVWKSRCYGMV